ncbi:MAG TPA: LTA synthase family protein [Polyangiaceae bacterium]
MRGEPVALVLSVVYALLLASERVPKIRALKGWRTFSEVFPVLCVITAIQCAAHWFTAASEIRPPKFMPCLAAAMALALPTAVVTHARARRIVAGVTIVVTSFLALADALYYRFFGGILPLLGTSNAKQAWEVSSSIAALLMTRDLAFVYLLASGVWLALSRGDAPALGTRAKRLLLGGTLAASFVSIVFLGLDLRSWVQSFHSVKIFSWRQKLHETGIFGAHARDVARLVRSSRRSGEPPTPERVQELSRYLESHRRPAPDELFGVARGKNLIVIQVEALQQWVIDTRAHGVEISPFLNRLKRERALYFSGVWDQTMVSPTADAEFASMNSLHPMADAAICFRYAGNDFVALPGVLAHLGYSTLSAHAFERGFWNRAAIHPRYGFQHSFFDRELGDQPKIGWGLADKAFLLRALERVDRTQPPFMAFFITLSSHHPYDYVPVEERHIDTSGLPDMLNGYVGSMHYVDEALAGFFAAFEQRPYAKDTVVVVYGDHESRIPLDAAAEARAEKVLSLDSQTMKDVAGRSFATRKIPMLVVLPGAKEGRTLDGVGGHIDIAPTLLHLLGVPKPKAMMGRPLVESGGVVFRAEGSAVEGDRVRQSDGNCRTLAGKGLPASRCDDLGKRGEEQVQISWAITQYDLADRLSGEHHAASR